MFKKFLKPTTLVAGALAVGLTLSACAGAGAGATADPDASTPSPAAPVAEADGMLVGVSMPTQTSERWIADGNAVREGLEAQGFGVELQFANDDIPTQQQQIDQMITLGVDVLVIAAVDGSSLSNQLQTARDNGVKIISYDRMLMNTENVDFYITFDNYEVGVQQAVSLLQGLGVLDYDGNETGATGPFSIEIFAGSLDDSNAHFYYDAAMNVLQPFLDNGTIVIPSGQTEIGQVATLRWLQETAQRRMEDLLTAHYGGGTLPLHGVLSPFDGMTRGIITALQNAGFGPTIAEGMPVVTGQDAEIASVALMDQGIQYSTIFKDTRDLAAKAVDVAVAFANGTVPTPNDTESYHNGVFYLPTYLIDTVIVTRANIVEALVDTDFYTLEQIERGQMG